MPHDDHAWNCAIRESGQANADAKRLLKPPQVHKGDPLAPPLAGGVEPIRPKAKKKGTGQ